MRLIFIHGRSQQGKDANELRRTWIDAWHRGLAAAGLDAPRDWDIRFPYYGNLLDQLVQHESAPTGATKRGEPSPGGLDPQLLAFETEVLTDIAQTQGIDPDSHFAGQPRERGLANWEWVQALLRALDEREPDVGSAMIERHTRDVFYYLTLPHVRQKIDDLILAEMTPGPCIVVGHSLGSVVGYNVLHQTPPGVVVKRYVTVGSPLGVHAVNRRLKQPLSMPPAVADWYNAMDERDVVALRDLTGQVFHGVTPRIRNHTGVRNHTDNRHGIIGYLDDPRVAREIRSA